MPQPRGDRRGHEGVRTGHEREFVAVAPVAVDQLLGLGPDVVEHVLTQERLAPGFELGAREARKKLHLEGKIALDVERSSLVGRREMADARAVVLDIEAADAHEEVRPRVGAVDRQQRVVEVEQGEFQCGVRTAKARIVRSEMGMRTSS